MTWTMDEHKRFIDAIQLHPFGPWKQIADYVGTKTAQETAAHARNYIAKAMQDSDVQHGSLPRQRVGSDTCGPLEFEEETRFAAGFTAGLALVALLNNEQAQEEPESEVDTSS